LYDRCILTNYLTFDVVDALRLGINGDVVGFVAHSCYYYYYIIVVYRFYPNRGYGIDGLHLFQNLQLQTHNYINMLYRLQVILNFFHIVSPLSIFYSTI